ncbi:MAG: hypothetical protein IKP23_03825 [Elusimicrobiaceae bacterium]|nr:hypothetical protein [Elusimicrobiaceae bacterium]
MQKNTFSSSNKYSSLLGLLLGMSFVVILVFITLDKTNIKNKLAINEVNSCLELDKETKTLKNTCQHYSFTFPMENTKVFIEKEVGMNYFCQDNNEELLCVVLMKVTDKDFSFSEDFLKKEIEGASTKPIKSWAKEYSGNSTQCFLVNRDDSLETNCFLKVAIDEPKMIWGFLSSEPDSTNLKTMMNSYKSW